MQPELRKTASSLALLLVTFLAADPAAAFRCGSKLVKDGMHEQEVIAICGEPATSRFLGYAVRSVDVRARRSRPGGWTDTHFPGYGAFLTEVAVTEFIYNFGPRKFMRRLVFEGGLLVTIESLGHGYVEQE